MNYKEYRKTRQAEFDSLPIIFAFDDRQLVEGMEKLGLAEHETYKLCRIGAGGFMKKEDLPLVRAWADKDNLDDLMKDYDFAKSAFYCEMCNHEYSINYQGDFDVISCFGKIEYVDALDEVEQYFNQLKWSDVQRKAYRDAQREYNKAAIENDWF